MKKLIFFLVLALSFVGASAQDWANLSRYTDANQTLASYGKGKVVLVGDSITDFWVRRSPSFFEKYGFICRGISGQTTPQMLLRFRTDVIDTEASTVVILAGTNDVAENTGPATDEQIIGNIASMCDMAKAHGIRVVICSILPARQYSWKKSVHPEVRIPELNAKLRSYAEKNHITYVDYFSAMVDRENEANANGLPARLSKDGVHPNGEGYAIMEELLLKALSSKEIKAAKKDNGDFLKLMSYNVRNCKGMDGKVNFDRVAAIISDYNPRFVAIQELDSLTQRYGRWDVLKALADRCGMEMVYSKSIDFDGGGYGIGILSREKALRVKKTELPGKEEKRSFMMVEFETCIFCNTHLSLTAADRLSSVKIIAEACKEFKAGSNKTLFICGDWNDTPDSETLKAFAEYFDIISNSSINTFPSDHPDCTIDYIAVWKGDNVKVSDSFVAEASCASDHRPVMCSVKALR